MAVRVVSLHACRRYRWQQLSWIHQTEIGGTTSPEGRVDGQLAVVDMKKGPRSHTSPWRGPDHCRCTGYERHMDAETVTRLCAQEQLSEAVEALGVLVQRDCGISQTLFYTVVRKCAVKKDLVLGRRVHALTVERGYESDPFLCNHILRMYAAHGRLEEAMDVFFRVGKPNAFMWSSMISAHVRHGQTKQAIRLYHEMDRASVKADGHVFVAALQACAREADLETGQQVHADLLLVSGDKPAMFVSNCLVDMYAKCGSLGDAHRVFDALPQKDVVTWNALIAGYSQQGMGQKALQLYTAMQEESMVEPDPVTFLSLLQACATMGSQALETGMQLHARIREHGLWPDMFLGSSLVNMYAKCGSLEDAQRVFDEVGERNVVTWNAMLAGYAQHGKGQETLQLYSAMRQEGIVTPNRVTFVSLLHACAIMGTQALEQGRHVHAQIVEQGLQTDIVVGCSLVDMYAKCGSLEEAKRVFEGIPEKDVVVWNAMMAGYCQQGMGEEALQLHSAMEEEGVVCADSATFACLLHACASMGTPALEKGKELHLQIGEHGLGQDVVVGCSLVNMYAKCGSLEDAQLVFDGLAHKNVLTWNAVITGYAKQGKGVEALQLYTAMQEEGIAAPDSVTFVCLLQACACVGAEALEKGKHLHARITEHGLQDNAYVACSLVNMYAKCGSLESAQGVFNGLVSKNVVTWTALMGGYSQQGMGEEALRVYRAMHEEGVAAPDSVTFACLLQAYAHLAAVQSGRQLHAEMEAKGLEGDRLIAMSLINMYAKSGSMMDAQLVFDALPERDIVAWNSLITGYARQGNSKEVFDLVMKMTEDGVHPDSITFLSLLTACSHAGLVSKGKEYFQAMSRCHGITPTAEHYTCMVDLLGRAGHLEEALTVARTIPTLPHAAVWHTLLGASQKWSNVDVGRHAFYEAVKMDDKDAAAYVSMSNIYTSAQMLEQAQALQARRIQVGARKQPGQSWWTDTHGLVHTFLVRDRNHPSSERIYSRLKYLLSKTTMIQTPHSHCRRSH